MKHSLFAVSALVACLALAPQAASQPTDPTSVSVFRYVPVGRPALAVDVWGGVPQPGRYLVEPGASLLDVLALAGGPALTQVDDLGSRTATVTVTRGAGDARTVAVRLSLSDLADGAAVPVLDDGDLVMVRTAGAGRMAVPVDVWGAVGRAGRYDVEPGSSLRDVLTLAGGPVLVTDDDRVARTATVTLTRMVGGVGMTAFEGSLETLAMAPPLLVEPGDLVAVHLSQRQRFTWRDVLTVATGTASVAVLVLRIAVGK